MKITDLKLTVMELPRKVVRRKIVPVRTVSRIQFTHQPIQTNDPAYEIYLHVLTDEGVEGVCTASYPEMTPAMFQILRDQVIGENPLQREYLYQKLHRGTRWVYQTPGWFGNFDNCLWDIAGKVAGLPVCHLIGQVRDRIQAYYTSGDGPLEKYLTDIEEGREKWGITAYKFHTYKGGKADIPIFREVRKRVGPDYILINDPVCSYDLLEAIEVGHVMEDLDFVWLEEPFHEQELRQYQKLCQELTIPVMATEMLMHDVTISSQWLLAGATDLLRGNARNSTTSILKMAHLAELYGGTIELNAAGGLGGHVHVQLQCAIANTQFYEYFKGLPEQGKEAGVVNSPDAKDGYLYPSYQPGWGAEIDWEYVKKHTVKVY